MNLLVLYFSIISTLLKFNYQFLVSNFGPFFFQNFSPNPYFEDSNLTKAFSFSDEGTTKITGTTIKWKEGMVRLVSY